uniref:Glial cell line-derived neurotrophic factor n=1 Tax=Poecilia reticulata TaxID=8081 RepID=A0A3P9PDM7_POERE
MKLWDVLATCFLLLTSVATRPLYQNTQQAKRTRFPSSYSDSGSLSVEDEEPLFQHDIEAPYPDQFEDVMDFIEATIGRLRRSSETSGNAAGRREQRQRGAANTRGTREERRGHGGKKRGRGRGGGRGGKGGGSRGCLLKEVHLNVTDLGLGYQTKEELIFRYCSGPCIEAETNYDKILNNLTHNKKLDKDTPSRTCCRPIAFDDDLSFLDDDVVYHTLKKHSARKCACV